MEEKAEAAEANAQGLVQVVEGWSRTKVAQGGNVEGYGEVGGDVAGEAEENGG